MSTRTARQNPMLAEMLIVLLFFALSACVLAGVFATAYKSGERARSESEALLWAEDLAEGFALSNDGAGEYLSAEGWTYEDGAYRYSQKFSKTEYSFSAVSFERAYKSGKVLGFELTALAGGEPAFEMPASNFVAEKGV